MTSHGFIIMIIVYSCIIYFIRSVSCSWSNRTILLLMFVAEKVLLFIVISLNLQNKHSQTTDRQGTDRNELRWGPQLVSTSSSYICVMWWPIQAHLFPSSLMGWPAFSRFSTEPLIGFYFYKNSHHTVSLVIQIMRVGPFQILNTPPINDGLWNPSAVLSDENNCLNHSSWSYHIRIL